MTKNDDQGRVIKKWLTRRMDRRCDRCGHRGPPHRSHPGRLLAVAFVWLIPLTFLLQGYWPFGIVPVTLLTVWAVLTNDRICPACGAPWSSRSHGHTH
ncbi:MAG: hypothetical protein ACFCVA_01445 [Gammaproteobacteria bacterium]